MARFVINGSVFDTETATEVIKYRKSYPGVLQIMGRTIYYQRDTTLYKTSSGNWFSVSVGDYDRLHGHAETAETAKSILKDLCAVELYAEHFEPLPFG